MQFSWETSPWHYTYRPNTLYGKLIIYVMCYIWSIQPVSPSWWSHCMQKRLSTVLNGLTCFLPWGNLSSAQVLFHGLGFYTCHLWYPFVLIMTHQTTFQDIKAPDAIEALAAVLQSDARIKGSSCSPELTSVCRRSSLVCWDPAISIHRILELLETFWQFSGYRLNFGKNIFFPINQQAKFPHILRHPKHLRVSLKVILPLSLIKPRWSALPTSLAVWVNTLKWWSYEDLWTSSRLYQFFLPNYYF